MWHFDVPLSIRLEVNDAGDGKASDRTDWVNAGLFGKVSKLGMPMKPEVL